MSTWCSATGCSRSWRTPHQPWPRSLLCCGRADRSVCWSASGMPPWSPRRCPATSSRPGTCSTVRSAPRSTSPGHGGTRHDSGPHRFTAEEVVDLLASTGFTDIRSTPSGCSATWCPAPCSTSSPGRAALVELEHAVSTRPEYLALATQVHALAHRADPAEPSPGAGDEPPTGTAGRTAPPPRRHGRVLRLRVPGTAPTCRRAGHRRGGNRGSCCPRTTWPAQRRRSGMPMARARRLCPEAVVRPRLPTFSPVSTSVMENFRRVTPPVEALSLDEAFLDVAGRVRRLGSPSAIAEHSGPASPTSRGSPARSGWPATVGVAKLASRLAKPDGVLVVPPQETTAFLHPLAVGELWGVGEKTTELLNRLGLMTVGDIAHTPLSTLQRAVGPRVGAQLHQLAWGEDRRMVTPRRGADEEPDKSMGADETFGRDTDDPGSSCGRSCGSRRRSAAGCGPRSGRPDRHAEGPVRRLHHDHPLPHPRGGHRRDPGDLPDRGRPVHRARSAAGPAPAGGGAGGGAGCRATRSSGSWCSAPGTGLARGRPGRRPSRLPVRGRGGPACLTAPDWGPPDWSPERSRGFHHERVSKTTNFRIVATTAANTPCLARAQKPFAPWRKTVPLSEEELRLLEQMERALVAEDPKLASTLRGTRMRQHARRRRLVGGVVFSSCGRPSPDVRCSPLASSRWVCSASWSCSARRTSR